MKKKLISILLVGILSLSFTGCARGGDSDPSKNRFYSINQSYDIDGVIYKVWIDKETGNTYLVCSTSSTLVPLYDENGKIQQYKSN